jgi:hypothetical protein
MRKAMRMLLLMLGVLMAAVSLRAQCATGTVEVRGKVDSDLGRSSQGIVAVTLETPKGRFSNKTVPSNGEFEIGVRFDKTSFPYFPLWGERCNNLPKYVDVRVTEGAQVVAQRRLKFKDNFETSGGLLYRLKKEITLSVRPGAMEK